MTKIITENFKTETTKDLYKSLENDNFYVVGSTAITNTEYRRGLSISNTQFSKREFQRRAIFGTKIDVATRGGLSGTSGTNLARYMFLENAWTSGRVYDAFDDTKDIETLDMIVTISQTNGSFIVLKCIDNNNGAPSTDIVGATDSSNYQYFTASDGYVWHKMFTVTADDVTQFRSADSLPLPEYVTGTGGYGDEQVVLNAKESISRIAIESTLDSQFNQYLFGPTNSINDASDVICVNPDTSLLGSNVRNVVVSTTVKSGRTLYTDPNAYANMYLRDKNTGKLYDVIASTTSLDTNQITLSIETDDTFVAQQIYQLVIKILVSQSEIGGERCKAYGKIDEHGTLKNIDFDSRGTKYKFAMAQVVYPPFLKGSTTVRENPTTLRAIVSPKGGHGSDPINELAMSKLTIATVFQGASAYVPDTNTYSVVGLLKNPTFSDSSGNPVTPTDGNFDNRTVIQLDGDHYQLYASASGLSGGGQQNDYIEQYIETVGVKDLSSSVICKIVDPSPETMSVAQWQSIGATSNAVGTEFTSTSTVSLPDTVRGTVSFVRSAVDTSAKDYDYRFEVVKARIHEVMYDAVADKTKIFLVDYYGDFMHDFQRGIFYVKSTPTSTTSINNKVAESVTYGQYDVYSGQLLHFIDFSPITRNSTKNEKIKFTFDF